MVFEPASFVYLCGNDGLVAKPSYYSTNLLLDRCAFFLISFLMWVDVRMFSLRAVGCSKKTST